MPRRSKADAAQTRRTIVAAARALFTEHGFTTTTTAAISRAAGVTEGAFFNHFKDKRAIFREILVALQTQYDGAVRMRAIGDGRVGTPIDAMIRGCRASIELAQEPSFARIVMIEGRAVLGEDEWHRIDSGMGALSTEYGLRAIAGAAGRGDAPFKPMALLVLGMLNEIIFATLRGELPDGPDASLALIGSAITAWTKH
jgi:AcrR family transcriptional regulator